MSLSWQAPILSSISQRQQHFSPAVSLQTIVEIFVVLPFLSILHTAAVELFFFVRVFAWLRKNDGVISVSL